MSGFDLYDWARGLRTKTAAGEGRMPRPGSGGPRRRLMGVALAAVVIYGLYFWEVRRVVVPADHVLVLMKKNGSKSLAEGQLIIPRAPDQAKDPARYAAWEKEFGDCNGICEQVAIEGTYFGYSPFDYERWVLPVSKTNALVPNKKVGVVVKKF